MARGDHIYVRRPRGYTHHGIDCGDGIVIHYSGEPGSTKPGACITRSTIDDFLQGGVLHVRAYGSRDDAETTCARAESRLGGCGYHLVTNNCEHFATWCCTGRPVSQQVRGVGSLTAQGAVAATTVTAAGGVIAAAGTVQGLSAAGIMSGLASAGAMVGGGAALGPAAIGAAPALAAIGITQVALRDDVSLPDSERAARRDGRVASVVGASAATVGGVTAISAMGTTAGLSAAGISSGLAAIGGSMVAGATIVAAAPVVAAAGGAAGVFLVSRWIRHRRAGSDEPNIREAGFQIRNPMSDTLWLGADECNELMSDHDFGSTIDNIETQYGISTQLKCWQLEEVPTSQIDPFQLIDDPHDHEGNVKAESIRQSFRGGDFIPPVIIIHRPARGQHPYVLIEGRHRYNAAHREAISSIKAWVAHIGCCGGPVADL